MQFFVNPKDVTRLYPWGEATKEHWVEVKNHLSAKEEQDVRAAGIPHMLQKPGDPNASAEQAQRDAQGREVKMGLDMGRMALVRVKSYVVRWSLTNDGAAVPVSEAAIGELLPEVFDALDKAIDEHKKVQAAGKDQAPAGASSRKSA